ncbi:MAG: PAS domain-containing protein [Caldimonas sp.]
MNNPLPVEPFSVAEAARRTWPVLIDAMLEAVCLVEPEALRIVAANAAAGRLFGVEPSELVGRDMRAAADTPEDAAFWAGVTGSGGRSGGTGIVSETLVVDAAGRAVPVLRRVSRIEPAAGNVIFVVAMHDRSDAVRVERAAGIVAAELAATLESVRDGVLVVDLAGHISNFNRRFAALWEVPEEMLLLRADDEIFDWMRQRVAEPAVYMRRLAEVDASEMLQASDVIVLRSGAVLERASVPQRSQGRTIGRVFSYRVIAAGLS